MYQMHFLCTPASFSVPAVGIFSRSRLKGTQGGRLDTTAQVWVPPGPRGARSGRSKSLDLASNHGIAIRSAEPSKVIETPKCRFFSFFALLLYLVRVPLEPSHDVYTLT